MRKRFLILIFAVVVSVLMLSGCHQNNASSKPIEDDMSLDSTYAEINKNSPDAEVEYKYEEGVYPVKKWEASMSEKSDDTITTSITEKEAVSIACTEFEGIQQTGIGKDYVLQGVFFDTEDQVWIVYFSPEPLVPGDCYHIAISQSTGDVLNAWPGE